MTPLHRLTVALAVAVLTASAPAWASPSCKATHSGACASNGAACGPPREHGRCETFHHRTWRGAQAGCACRIKTPHGTIVVP